MSHVLLAAGRARMGTVLLICCCWSTGLLAAAGSSADQAAAPPQAGLPGANVTAGNPVATTVPALPGTKTAADTLRELLEMNPQDRAQALADRSEHQRKYLESRLREYDVLSPAEREARLKQFELTCHMTDLMKLSPSNRAARLSVVPADLRPTVDDRLRQWDLLSPKVQQEVLEYDTTANYFLRVRPSGPPVPRSARAEIVSPPIPGGEEKPSRLAESLNEFIELPSRAQQKTLDTLPAGEREAMEQTLRAFANLPAEQRKICINSFEKFSRMSKEQRDQFLKNAARWQSMSAQERETWRALMQIVPRGGEPAANPGPVPLPPAAELNSGPATASNAVAR